MCHSHHHRHRAHRADRVVAESHEDSRRERTDARAGHLRASDAERTRTVEALRDRAAAGHLRASDAERERTVEALRDHAAAGRLAAEELERRVEAAFAATTRADLDALEADLPPLPRAPRPAPTGIAPAWPPGIAAEWATYAVVAAILLTVWALTGADAFWPAWPLGFWGAALVFKAPWAHAGRRATPGRG
jgi:hypothetical protein